MTPTPAEARREVEEALTKAEALRKERRYQEGIELLLTALRHGLERDKIYFRLGNIYFDAGELEKAELAYKKAIEANPEHVNAHHNLSVVYRRQGRIGEYIKLRKRALKLVQRHPEQVQLTPEQLQLARRWAWRLLLTVLGIIAALALALFLLAR